MLDSVSWISFWCVSTSASFFSSASCPAITWKGGEGQAQEADGFRKGRQGVHSGAMGDNGDNEARSEHDSSGC